MKIQVLTDGGQVIDSYTSVTADDVDGEVFGPAIRSWLKKALRIGEDMQEPIIDGDEELSEGEVDDGDHYEESSKRYKAERETRQREARERAERIRRQLADIEAGL